MRAAQHFLLVLAILLTACSNGSAASSGSDPLDSFEELVVELVGAASDMGRTPAYADPDGEFEWEFELSGAHAFDVVETDSLVTPYDGELALEMIWYANGERLEGSDVVLQVEYEYRDDMWQLVSATRCIDTFRRGDWNCDDDRPQVAFWQQVVQGLQ